MTDRPTHKNRAPKCGARTSESAVISPARRRLLLGACAWGAATALSGGPFRINLAHAATLEPIRIGFPVPLTGPYSLEAQDQVRCAQLAVEEFNAAGGLDGRMAELLVRDDHLSPGTAAAQTRFLILHDKAKFIVGSLSASVQLSVNAMAASFGAVYVSISQSEAITEAANVHPTTFHEGLNPHMTCQAVGEYVFDQGGDGLRVAYLVADYSYGYEMMRGMKHVGKAYGIETVAEVRHPIATQDFRPFLPKISEAKPDIVCLCNFGRDQMLSVRDATTLGLKDQARLVAPVLLYHQRLSGGAEIFEGVVGGTNYHWTLEDTIPTAKAFNTAHRARYARPPSDYGAYAYGGVRALLSAMTVAQSAEPDIVAEAMSTMEYDHYKGRQWFRACDHQSVQSVSVVASKPQSAMANPYDVFDVVHTEQASEKLLRSCDELGFK